MADEVKPVEIVTEGFIRQREVPGTPACRVIHVQGADGKDMFRVNIFINANGRWGDVDVIPAGENVRCKFLAWDQGTQIVSTPLAPGLIAAVDVKVDATLQVKPEEKEE